MLCFVGFFSGCTCCFWSFLRYFMFSVDLGRSEVVKVVKIASNCFYVVFLFDSGPFRRRQDVLASFRLFTFCRLYFWQFVLSNLIQILLTRCRLDCFSLCSLFKSFKLVFCVFSTVLRLCYFVFAFSSFVKWFCVVWDLF